MKSFIAAVMNKLNELKTYNCGICGRAMSREYVHSDPYLYDTNNDNVFVVICPSCARDFWEKEDRKEG